MSRRFRRSFKLCCVDYFFRCMVPYKTSVEPCQCLNQTVFLLKRFDRHGEEGEVEGFFVLPVMWHTDSESVFISGRYEQIQALFLPRHLTKKKKK